MLACHASKEQSLRGRTATATATASTPYALAPPPQSCSCTPRHHCKARCLLTVTQQAGPGKAGQMPDGGWRPASWARIWPHAFQRLHGFFLLPLHPCCPTSRYPYFAWQHDPLSLSLGCQAGSFPWCLCPFIALSPCAAGWATLSARRVARMGRIVLGQRPNDGMLCTDLRSFWTRGFFLLAVAVAPMDPMGLAMPVCCASLLLGDTTAPCQYTMAIVG